MSNNANMKAALVETNDGPFRIVEIARPEPAEGQVLVRIRASGVNPLDTKIRAGAAAHARHPLPAVLGLDMAGTIAAIGPGVGGFKVGDEVYGLTGGVGGNQGSLAQYAAVDAHLLAIKPSNISMREAAGLPLIFITAWEGLVDRANVQAGSKVLIQGGGGGVGHVAIQIARSFGAEVFATDRGAKADFIRSLGATPIDFETENVADYVGKYTTGKGFDLVYDTGGGKVLDASFAAVKRFGHVVSCLGWGQHALAPLSFKAGTYSGVFTLLPLLTGEGREHHGDIMRYATRLVEAGKLVPTMDTHRFSLDEVGLAHDLLNEGRAHGRVVVEIG